MTPKPPKPPMPPMMDELLERYDEIERRVQDVRGYL